MQKPKSSRAAVRNTPQPKAHCFIPAVFVDDYGRDRSLTIASARTFSKKKLDAASRAIERKSDRDMDRAIEAGDRETAKAIRRLRQQEREIDRSIASFFRRRIRTKTPPTAEIAHKPTKARHSAWPSRAFALPKYDRPIRDKFDRRGVFFRSRYYSARTAKPGVSARVAAYIYRGAALDDAGIPMFRTNIGQTIDETACGLDHLEQVSRSSQKNAKVLNHAVLAMDYRWTPEQMLEVGERWAEERFGRNGLPFALSLHEPPSEGDERNWHLHAVWSWRPFERVDDHEWLVSETLRTDLDGAQGMWVLRERLAAIMTEMSFEAGDAEIYTALSYAARGLPVTPQIHLDEGRTRQAREGKIVPANEENHDRLVRSIAALADDELRTEDDRLARLQNAAEHIARRFTRKSTAPTIPSLKSKVTEISTVSKAIGSDRLRMAKSGLRDAIVRPILGRRAAGHFLGRIMIDRPTSNESKNFANLRIPEFAVAPPYNISRSKIPLRQVPPLIEFAKHSRSQLVGKAAPRTPPSLTISKFSVLITSPVFPLTKSKKIYAFPQQFTAVIPRLSRVVPASLLRVTNTHFVPSVPSMPSVVRQKFATLRVGISGKALVSSRRKSTPALPTRSVRYQMEPRSLTSRPSVRLPLLSVLDFKAFDRIRTMASNLAQPSAVKGRSGSDIRRIILEERQVDMKPTVRQSWSPKSKTAHERKSFIVPTGPELDSRITDFVSAMRAKPTGLCVWDDGSVHPVSAVASTWGVSQSDLRTQAAKQALLPLYVDQELRFDRLESELRDARISKKELRDPKPNLQAQLSKEAAETLETYRRSALLLQAFDRVCRTLWRGEKILSRTSQMEERDIDWLAINAASEQRKASIAAYVKDVRRRQKKNDPIDTSRKRASIARNFADRQGGIE